MERKQKLGEILIGQGLISSEQLEEAIEEQKKTQLPLGEIMLRRKFIGRETDILVALSQQLGFPVLVGDQLKPHGGEQLKYLLPEALARKHFILPLAHEEGKLTVAFAHTFDSSVIDALKQLTSLEINPVLASKKELEEHLDTFYKTTFLDSESQRPAGETETKSGGRKLRLGEILIRQGLITPQQLDQALKEQKTLGLPLGETLVHLQFVRRETDIMVALSQQLNLPIMIGDQLNPRADQRLKDIFSQTIANEKLALPLFRSGRNLTVAFAKPFDLLVLDDLRKITGMEIIPVLASRRDLESKLQVFYGSTQLEEVVSGKGMEDEIKVAAKDKIEGKVQLVGGVSEAGQPPVIRFVDLLLQKAIEDQASDIHIEPYEDKLMIRYRLDGILYELPPPPFQLHLAVVSRIKILSKLDIAEKRIPQDGSFSIEYKSRSIDVRVSTVPVVFGERVVMRLLDKGGGLKKLSDLGFEPEQLKTFETVIQRPYGLVYITGPTGSGKSTTLYAAIQYIKSSETNILTIEDPVEFQMAGIGQVQVKPDIGLTFAAGLRAFLRQDPDIILVGEVRDEETAEVCVRAALTGHLVMSTLHTNDAPTAITRLIDIGVKPYLVASSILMVGAQRLVRRLCTHCKQPYEATEREVSDFKLKTRQIYKAKGCKWCHDIGYWGRMAIYEVMPVNEMLRSLIARGEDLEAIRRAEKEAGIQTLFESGIRKVEQGMTTLDEVLSITFE